MAVSDAISLLQDYLVTCARRAPHKVALVSQGRRLTYQQIDARTNALANVLGRRGVVRGDRVVILAENTVESIISFWGVLKANAVAVMIPPETKTEELGQAIAETHATALVGGARLAPVLGPAASSSLHLRVVILAGTADDPALAGLPVARWESVLAREDDAAPPRLRASDTDLAAILDGSELTHARMRAAVASLIKRLENVEDDVILGVLPLSSEHGLYPMITACAAGARFVLERSFAYPSQILDVVVREGVTGFPGAPAMFAVLAEMASLTGYDLRGVRYVTNAGALAPEHARALGHIFPAARILAMEA